MSSVGHRFAIPGAPRLVSFGTHRTLPRTNASCQQMIWYDHTILRRVAEPSPRMILAILSRGGISYALLQSLVVPALPEFQQSLHASESAVGWMLTAFL